MSKVNIFDTLINEFRQSYIFFKNSLLICNEFRLAACGCNGLMTVFIQCDEYPSWQNCSYRWCFSIYVDYNVQFIIIIIISLFF